MKAVLFFILSIILIGFVASSQINLDYEKQINSSNISFSLSIQNFSQEKYDVKIDLTSNGKRISKIWDSGWKSTMYYINEVISNDEYKEFIVSTQNFEGEANITVKIRDDSKKVFIFDNYSIKINAVEEIKENNSEKDMEEDINESIEKEQDTQKVSKENTKQNNSITKKVQESSPPPIYDTIVLNPKTIKTEENFLGLGKEYTKYSIIGFCILLFLLYTIKPKKDKNEFRS